MILELELGIRIASWFLRKAAIIDKPLSLIIIYKILKDYFSGFPFLSLPPEIRNIVYRETLLKDRLVASLRQPGLLCANKQIRGEALAMFYSQNKFFLLIIIQSSQVLQKVQEIIQSMPKTIEAHVRDIKVSVHYKLDDPSPCNEHLQYFLDHLPYHFILADRQVGSPEAERTDYSSARKDFIAKLLADGTALTPDMWREMDEGVYDRELLPRALERFDVAWLLAHAFPEARKSITTIAHLPLGLAYTFW
ncbi:hypothetical protein INS49_014367 [Diaporthe citri]|uniref:uncharacterized protein n=1 Tax=Diaporthe citri TaxID=83186 RepID=UPI001C80E668|nr:uncharacterized protein INS49_014367 [Diaporthe citri]KAG6358483.1 hypothetical protein INS49_014367 [Diaporthe citri]